MTLILAIIAALEAVVIVWLYWSRRSERLIYVRHAAAWFASMIRADHEIAALREMVNQQRRNTGKAEM